MKVGRINASKIFTAGHSREIGLYDEAVVGSFPGFRRGTTKDVFQIDGIWLRETDALKVRARKAKP